MNSATTASRQIGVTAKMLISPAVRIHSKLTQRFLSATICRFSQSRARRDAGAAAEKIERGFGARICPADHDDILVPVQVRVGEIVRDVRQIVTGNAK